MNVLFKAMSVLVWRSKTESLVRRRHFHLGIIETFLECRTAARYRCSIITRLKFPAVCLRRNCWAPREFIEGQPVRTVPPYITISVRNLAPERLFSSRELLLRSKAGREEAERTSRRVTHSPCFTRESRGKQLCSSRTKTLNKAKWLDDILSSDED